MLYRILSALSISLLTATISWLIVIICAALLDKLRFLAYNLKYADIIGFIKKAESEHKIPLILFKNEHNDLMCCAQWDHKKTIFRITDRRHPSSFLMFPDGICLHPVAGTVGVPLRSKASLTRVSKETILTYLDRIIDEQAVTGLLNGTLPVLDPVLRGPANLERFL